MYMNAAIEQKLTGDDRNNRNKIIEVMQSVRGTVQADILKEDQAQKYMYIHVGFRFKANG